MPSTVYRVPTCDNLPAMEPKKSLHRTTPAVGHPLRLRVALLWAAAALLVAIIGEPSPVGVGGSPAGKSPRPDGWPSEVPPASDALSIQAEAFKPGADIPRKFSCQGSDTSPALAWTEPPAGTRSLALIADDPDAPGGTFVHWVLYDLPGTARRLAEALPRGEGITGGGRQGRNDFGKIGYGGPCPPPGNPHRYFFKLYALDRKLDLKAGASKSDVEEAIKGHVLAKAEVMGRYSR